MDEEVAEGKRDKQSETERIQRATVGGREGASRQTER